MKIGLITALLLVAYSQQCPGKPAYIFAKSNEDGLSLEWSASDEATSWTIEYRHEDSPSQSEAVSVPSLVVAADKLTLNTEYEVTVTAQKDGCPDASKSVIIAYPTESPQMLSATTETVLKWVGIIAGIFAALFVILALFFYSCSCCLRKCL